MKWTIYNKEEIKEIVWNTTMIVLGVTFIYCISGVIMHNNDKSIGKAINTLKEVGTAKYQLITRNDTTTINVNVTKVK